MRWRRRDRPIPGADEAIAWTKPPVPGGDLPVKATSPPSWPSPAPGHDPRAAIPRHDTGGLDFAIRVWKCGCILAFDGLGRITGTTTCTQPQDLDEELKRLAP